MVTVQGFKAPLQQRKNNLGGGQVGISLPSQSQSQSQVEVQPSLPPQITQQVEVVAKALNK